MNKNLVLKRRRRIALIPLVIVILAQSVRGALAFGPYAVTNLGALRSNVGWVSAINDRGQVVGNGSVESPVRAFLWQPDAPNGRAGHRVILGNDSPEYSSAAWDINEQGQIVGEWDGEPFLWQPDQPNASSGNITGLGFLPGGGYAAAYGINANGQVVGFAPSSSGDQPFIWNPATPNGSEGMMIGLGNLPDRYPSGGAAAINDVGQLVGASGRPLGHAFLQQADSDIQAMVDLGVLGGELDDSAAIDINIVGQIVGDSNTPDGVRAFIWMPDFANGAEGTMINLGTLEGDTYSVARSINDRGLVVGSSSKSTNEHPFIWSFDSGMVELNDLLDPETGAGWKLTQVGDINDRGQIVGVGYFNGVFSSVLLTPLPEPGSLLPILLCTAVGTIRTRLRMRWHSRWPLNRKVNSR